MVSLIDEACGELGISRLGQISNSVIMKQNKETLKNLLFNSLALIDQLAGLITTDFETTTGGVKSQMIESQQTIIKLQSELLACKDEQLDSLKVTVKSSVEESVKSEFRSYSAVLQDSSSNCEKSISTDELKRVVQNVVQEEDRSKNLMIFGLPEKLDEELNATVSEVFQAVGEKPRVESCRVGRKTSDKTVRPVKVTVASSTVVDQILSKVRRLKRVDKFKSVFVSADRSPEQRIQQRELIKELKRLSAEESDKRHFIKDGKVFSVAKTAS